MKLVYSYFQDFLSLFYPELCAACRKNLFKNESIICTDCRYNLPFTNFHLDPGNRFARQLWGRISFHTAVSYLHFQKGSGVQNLIHQLKYNNQPLVGVELGEMYGSVLKKSAEFDIPDLIVPVPLHPLKHKRRGYNQSDYFARGLALRLELSCNTDNLTRVMSTESQTGKSRFLRYENMRDVFAVTDPARFENKHLLLVDDVATTGSTLEACAETLLKINGVKISIATIAFAD